MDVRCHKLFRDPIWGYGIFEGIMFPTGSYSFDTDPVSISVGIGVTVSWVNDLLNLLVDLYQTCKNM